MTPVTYRLLVYTILKNTPWRDPEIGRLVITKLFNHLFKLYVSQHKSILSYY